MTSCPPPPPPQKMFLTTVLKRFGVRSWSFVNFVINGYSSCPAFLQFYWLIIGQDSTILPDEFSCWTKLTTHARWQILGNRKTSESYKTRENAFHKTREQLFIGKFSVSFREIFGKFENISSFHPIFWLHNNCDVTYINAILFLETIQIYLLIWNSTNINGPSTLFFTSNCN